MAPDSQFAGEDSARYKIEHPSYIVAEIPEPVRSQVQAMRDSLNTLTANLPVEITLAGSSGVGPIPAGTDWLLIERHLDRTLSDFASFRARFSAIRTFPQTSIFFLEPFDRSPFDQLHQKLRMSLIPFSGIRWPYHPHCTLRGGEPLSTGAELELTCRPFSPRRILDRHSFCLPTRCDVGRLKVTLSANAGRLAVGVPFGMSGRRLRTGKSSRTVGLEHSPGRRHGAA